MDQRSESLSVGFPAQRSESSTDIPFPLPYWIHVNQHIVLKVIVVTLPVSSYLMLITSSYSKVPSKLE